MKTNDIARFLLLTAFGITSVVSTAKEVSVEHWGTRLNAASEPAEDERLAGGAILITQDATHYGMESVAYLRDLLNEQGFSNRTKKPGLALQLKEATEPGQVYVIAQQSDSSSPESLNNPSGGANTSQGDSNDC